MFFINPDNFEGCQSKFRVNLNILAYEPEKGGSNIFFYPNDNFIDKLIWEFDSVENRDKAIEKIDEYVNEARKRWE